MTTKFLDKCLIMAFLLVVSVPCIGIFLEKQTDVVRKTFNRDPYPFPSIDVKRLHRTDFKAIDNWFADRALFITQLSKFWSLVNYKLGASTKPGQVIIGKNGWLFLGNDYAATIDQYTGKNVPSSNETLSQLNVFRHLSQVSKKNTIPFVVVIAPDKQDIYPEYLPDNIKPGRSLRRLDILEENLRKNDIDFISLREKECQAKETLGKLYGDLYLKGDSHWNYLGAFVAYQEIAKYMKKNGLKIRPLKPEFIAQKTKVTDLTNILHLTHLESNYPLPSLNNMKLDLMGKSVSGTINMLAPFNEMGNATFTAPYQIINKALHHKQICLVIGDSFSEALAFYFHNDCHNTVRIHNSNKLYSLADMITTYHPDIIVYEKVERDLILH